MKKIRKGKKILLILLAVIVVVLVVVLIVNLIKKIPKKPEPIDSTQQMYALPETTYSNMQVKNVVMEYLKEQDKTMVSVEIHNTTERTAKDEYLTALLIGPNENVLGQMETWIQLLEPGEQYNLSVVLKGDLTATTQIKLVEN